MIGQNTVIHSTEKLFIEKVSIFTHLFQNNSEVSIFTHNLSIFTHNLSIFTHEFITKSSNFAPSNKLKLQAYEKEMVK